MRNTQRWILPPARLKIVKLPLLSLESSKIVPKLLAPPCTAVPYRFPSVPLQKRRINAVAIGIGIERVQDRFHGKVATAVRGKLKNGAAPGRSVSRAAVLRWWFRIYCRRSPGSNRRSGIQHPSNQDSPGYRSNAGPFRQ